MDPKYANLPGIAINEPDVYESEELPESEQSEILPETKEFGVSEPVNVDIEVISCDALQCINKFHMKHLDGANPDLSDRMTRGYRSAFEIRTDGQLETPVQKLARLQAETQELIDQIEDMKKDMKVESKVTSDYVQQMQSLQHRLNGVDATTSFAGVQEDLKNIDAIVSEKYKDNKTTPEDSKFDLKIYSNSKNTEKLIIFDQRLNRIETVLGAHATLSELTDDINCSTIKESISMLDAQLKMLDLDTLSELQEQVSQMKVEQETASDNLGEDDMADVHELYTMVKKSQCLVDSVPLLTDRLTSLKGVHEQAGELCSLIQNVDTVQTQITSELSSNRELLTSVETVLSENMSTIKKNCLSLEKRISMLENKKK